jgi:hypothetical protein
MVEVCICLIMHIKWLDSWEICDIGKIWLHHFNRIEYGTVFVEIVQEMDIVISWSSMIVIYPLELDFIKSLCQFGFKLVFVEYLITEVNFEFLYVDIGTFLGSSEW